jgi:hypothetical protein
VLLRIPPVLAALVFVLTACGAPAPTATPTPATSAFTSDDLSFNYPAGWNVATFESLARLTNAVVYLSTEQLTDPCQQTPNAVICDGKLIPGLQPDGVILDWSRWTAPNYTFDASAGTLIDVGGRRATVENQDAADLCRGFGGERQRMVIVEVPDDQRSFYEMTACMRGPDFTSTEADVDALLATVTWT